MIDNENDIKAEEALESISTSIETMSEIEELDYNEHKITMPPQVEEVMTYEEVKTEDIQNESKEPATIQLPTEKKENNIVPVKKVDTYIDYKTRLFGKLAIFIALLIVTFIFLQGAFSVSSAKMINYNENSNLDYRVYLKENNFYDTPYLGKNRVYIASLIDYVQINFRYNYAIEKEANVNFNYNVVAKLTIADGSSKNVYFEKDYTLLSNKAGSIKDGKNYNLNEQIKIDYGYYNSLANSFKQQYGVDTTSNLTVYLKVNKKSDIENATNTIDNSTMFVKIPLSEKSVNIELNYQDINNSNYIIEENDTKIDNVIFGILATISFIAALIFAIKLISLLTMLRTKKTIYDKFVEKILNEYDRLIVENTTGPDTKTNNIIKISKFEELLDVRDNLKLPIMYYIVAKHTKCYFYIKHNRDLYLMTVKAADLEKEEENN